MKIVTPETYKALHQQPRYSDSTGTEGESNLPENVSPVNFGGNPGEEEGDGKRQVSFRLEDGMVEDLRTTAGEKDKSATDLTEEILRSGLNKLNQTDTPS